MKKKRIKIISWISFFVILFVVMSFVRVSRDTVQPNIPKISIDVHGEMLFITEDDILHRLRMQQWVDTAQRLIINDLGAVETFINDMPEVDEAEVYRDLSGFVHFDVALKQVVARVFNADGSSYYIDGKGRVMPLSINYTAKVPVISGAVQVSPDDLSALEVIHIDSLKNKTPLPELYRLSIYVCSDAFLRSQITQIIRDQSGEYFLIPRVGNHVIEFGHCVDERDKFENLKIFYKEALKKVNGNIYDTISLKYSDQVVCSKR